MSEPSSYYCQECGMNLTGSTSQVPSAMVLQTHGICPQCNKKTEWKTIPPPPR
jgi:hypothetical protein